MRFPICRFLLCFPLAVLSSATGIIAAQEGGQTVALVDARLIDGNGQDPLESAALVIRGETLSAVGQADSVKFPNDAAVIDCHGQIIIPGLILVDDPPTQPAEPRLYWDSRIEAYWRPVNSLISSC